MYGKVCKYEGASVSRLWYFQCYQSYAESEDGMEGSQLECSVPLGQGAPPGVLGILQSWWAGVGWIFLRCQL